MNKFLALASASVALFIAGCGPDLETACEDYINAVNTCVGEAYPDDAGTYELDAEATCSVYDGQKGDAAQASADYLACLADAYNSADCSTPEGYAAVDITGCTL